MIKGTRMMMKRGAPLPYDAEVEYVETDGLGAYIDTGITPSFDTSVVSLSFRYVTWNQSYELSGYNTICGASPDTTLTKRYYSVGSYVTNQVFVSVRPTMSDGDRPALDTDIHDIKMLSSEILWDGVVKPSIAAAATFPPGVFCLGSRGTDAVAPTHPEYWFGNVRFYACKIHTGDVLVFDGIPVRKDGVAYMYDQVSGNLLGNAGASGTSVTYGPDKT